MLCLLFDINNFFFHYNERNNQHKKQEQGYKNKKANTRASKAKFYSLEFNTFKIEFLNSKNQTYQADSI